MSTPPSLDIPMLRRQLTTFKDALTSFHSSSSPFRILSTLPSTATSISTSETSSPPTHAVPPPKSLLILDSSFNPPTLAHLRILTSALQSTTQDPTQNPTRILLLLATQNADKAPKPASFEQRLVMMHLFAQDLLSSLPTSTSSQSQPPSEPQTSEPSQLADQIAIDIGVTTRPYFADKSHVIQTSAFYPPTTTQTHLIGYDTLTRLLDTKYYPPTHDLTPLHPFLSKHKLRVTYRADAEWGSKPEQDAYVRELAEGGREDVGGKKEWVAEGRIVLVEGRKEGEEVVSSTRVREAVKQGDREVLGRLVSESVGEWILSEGLYLEE